MELKLTHEDLLTITLPMCPQKLSMKIDKRKDSSFGLDPGFYLFLD